MSCFLASFITIYINTKTKCIQTKWYHNYNLLWSITQVRKFWLKKKKNSNFQLPLWSLLILITPYVLLLPKISSYIHTQTLLKNTNFPRRLWLFWWNESKYLISEKLLYGECKCVHGFPDIISNWIYPFTDPSWHEVHDDIWKKINHKL